MPSAMCLNVIIYAKQYFYKYCRKIDELERVRRQVQKTQNFQGPRHSTNLVLID